MNISVLGVPIFVTSETFLCFVLIHLLRNVRSPDVPTQRIQYRYFDIFRRQIVTRVFVIIFSCTSYGVSMSYLNFIYVICVCVSCVLFSVLCHLC